MSVAVAEAVNNAHSLGKLMVGICGATFRRDPSGLTALANALRDHTDLQVFSLLDICPRLEAAQDDTPDVLLQSLPACPHLRKVTIMTKYASADATKNLLQLHSTTKLLLVLTTESGWR
jgi:Ran GTPase-activating protein (RanGAP) involved in mRNA processing and transport